MSFENDFVDVELDEIDWAKLDFELFEIDVVDASFCDCNTSSILIRRFL